MEELFFCLTLQLIRYNRRNSTNGCEERDAEAEKVECLSGENGMPKRREWCAEAERTGCISEMIENLIGDN